MASFVLILRTPEQGMLFDGEISARALRGLTSILKRTSNPEEIVEELRKHNSQVRRRVRELLTVITESDSELMAIVTDGAEATWGRVSPVEAASALDAIRAVPATITILPLSSVLLTALNLARLTFEVWDRAENQKYSGQLDKDVLNQVDGLTVSQSEQLYNVQLEVEVDFAQDRSGPARRNRLLAIAASDSAVNP
jgi:hypothetical protein